MSRITGTDFMQFEPVSVWVRKPAMREHVLLIVLVFAEAGLLAAGKRVRRHVQINHSRSQSFKSCTGLKE